MSLARPVAGGVFGIEFPARRGPSVVDHAPNRISDFPDQRNASRFGVISTTQADNAGCNRQTHGYRYALTPDKGPAGQFSRMEIDTEAGAAGAAGLADAHGRLTRQRHSAWPEARYFFSKGVIGSAVFHGSAPTVWPLSRLIACAISSM